MKPKAGLKVLQMPLANDNDKSFCHVDFPTGV